MLKLPTGRSSFKSQGFTIIELLVVIVIIGLLTSVATASYIAAQKHARDSARKSSVNSIAAALESYYAVSHQFPGDALSQTNRPYPPGFPSACEKATNLTLGGSIGISPYYFYSPVITPCNGLINLGTGGGIADFPAGSSNTWLPGLSTFLSPIPIESKFSNANGDAIPDPTQSQVYADVCDYLDSTQISVAGSPKNACDQVYNQTRTLIYRNLLNHYAVYTRLESNQDADFDKEFTAGPYGKCISGSIAGFPDLATQFNCVPSIANSTNPIVVYLVRK